MPDQPIIRENHSGTPSVRGSRLMIYNIMDHHLAGQQAAWIAEFYDIPLADACAALEYIEAHRDELMPIYERDLAWARRGKLPHIEAMFAESHKKLMRLKEELEHKSAGEARDARAAG